MKTHFHLFVYGTLKEGGPGAHMLEGCTRVAEAAVAGSLYDVEGRFPALVLAGHARVHGQVWRCPVERLPALDTYEEAGARLFRRVGVQVGPHACWTYVAGPALARRLTPASLIEAGVWR